MDFRIESFSHHDGPFEDYLSLPRRLENRTDAQADAERAGTTALLNPKSNYYQYGSSKNFIAYRSDRPVGRITAFYNRLIRDHRSRYGLVGLFACEDDPEAARGLVSLAAGWLSDLGVEMLRGPMAGDIWHRWRFMTRGFDSEPFPGEPRQPAHYPELFIKAGFAPIRVYSTKRITHLPPVLNRLEQAAEQNRKRGIHFRRFNFDDMQEEMQRMFSLCLHSFQNYWAASDITEQQFLSLYTRWFTRIKPNHVLFVMDRDNAIVGMGLGLLAPADTLNIKSVAVLPNQYGFGLGQAIAAKLYRDAMDSGVKVMQHCLMDPWSPEQRWDGGTGEVTREYTLFERAL